MPIIAAAQAVTTTAVKVSTTAADGAAHTVVVAAVDGTVYAGGSAVTSSTGLPVAPGGVLSVRVLAADSLYLVSAAGTVNTRVLRTGADT